MTSSKLNRCSPLSILKLSLPIPPRELISALQVKMVISSRCTSSKLNRCSPLSILKLSLPIEGMKLTPQES